jgi:hypothetical protein
MKTWRHTLPPQGRGYSSSLGACRQWGQSATRDAKLASAVAIEPDPIRLISAGSMLETAIVAKSRWGDAGGRELDLFLFKGENFTQTDVDRVEITELPDQTWFQHPRKRSSDLSSQD